MELILELISILFSTIKLYLLPELAGSTRIKISNGTWLAIKFFLMQESQLVVYGNSDIHMITSPQMLQVFLFMSLYQLEPQYGIKLTQIKQFRLEFTTLGV